MKGQGADVADASRGQALGELGLGGLVERHARDRLRGDAAAAQFAHALDEDRGLAAARRRDDLHDPAARLDRPALRFVRRERAVGERRRRHAPRPRSAHDEAQTLQRVRVSELRLEERLRIAVLQAAVGDDLKLDAQPQCGLDDEAEQVRGGGGIVEDDVDDGELVGLLKPRKPRPRRAVQPAAAHPRRAHLGDPAAAQLLPPDDRRARAQPRRTLTDLPPHECRRGAAHRL